MKKIIFVCTGNTCRSVIAEYYTRSVFIRENIGMIVESRGVHASRGEMANTNTIAVLDENHIDCSTHVSRPFTFEDLQEADLVLTMTQDHLFILKNIFSKSEKDNAKLFTLKEYVGIKDSDIRDPFGCDLETYKFCFDEIKYLVDLLVKKIKEEIR